MSIGFLSELKRRNVFRMAGLYLVGAWLLVQVASTVLPMFGVPEWVPRGIVILLAIGLLPALAFAWIFELTPDGLKREADVTPEHSIVGQTGRRMEHLIVALLALALGYFAFDKIVLTPRREAALVAAARTTVKPHSTTQPELSIAVLPLANAGEQDQQFFADGLSESLIIALSQAPQLKVIGRNSAFQFRDSKSDSASIGRKLGVAHLLEGSVQHAGDAVRISLELIDAADGRTLWSQRYDRPYTDLFKLQDEITSAVAAALKAKLLPANVMAKQSDRPPSGNLDAYDAYLRGMQNMYQGNWPKMIEYQTKATRLDPGYAAAWAQLTVAMTATGERQTWGSAEAKNAFAAAHSAAETALRLAPELGLAHGALGNLRYTENMDWQGALAELGRALRLAPDSGQIHGGYSRVLASIGRLREAIEHRQRFITSEPLVAGGYYTIALLLIGAGHLDEAEKTLGIAGELSRAAGAAPSLRYMYIAILRGDAKTALQIAGQQSAPWRDLNLALAAQIGPDRAAADAALAKVLADVMLTASSPYQIAQAYALRGDIDHTLEWLDRAWTTHDTNLRQLLYDPLILRFREDPRLIAFCAKIGLPPPGTSEGLSIDQIRAHLATAP